MFSCFFPPFRDCLECMQGPSFTAAHSYSQLQNQGVVVRLDTTYMGDEAVLLKNGQRICGSGGALANIPIAQNKAYFEFSIQQGGLWGVGVANRSANLSHVPVSRNSWYWKEDGHLVAHGETVCSTTEACEEGDVIGVAFDHIDLQFYKNGVLLPNSLSNIKGQVFPMVYVDNSAIIDVVFRNFRYSAPDGYEEIIAEQTIL